MLSSVLSGTASVSARFLVYFGRRVSVSIRLKINLDPAAVLVERDADFSKLHNAIHRDRSRSPFNMGDVCESVASCFLAERGLVRPDRDGNCLPLKRLAVSNHSNGSFVGHKLTSRVLLQTLAGRMVCGPGFTNGSRRYCLVVLFDDRRPAPAIRSSSAAS